MGRVLPGALAGVLLLAGLAGCAAPSLPEGPSDAEIGARIAVELDREWANTGLEGIVARPTVPDPEPSESIDQRRFDCMSENGFTYWSFTDAGLRLEGREPTTEEQLVYYSCNAMYPTVEMLSADQLDYIYDYYARYLVPCLRAEGYTVQPMSRIAFVQPFQGWRWTPYQSITEPITTQAAYDRLLSRCPVALPGIDGWNNTLY